MAESAHETIPRRRPARESAARTYPRALPIVPVRARGLTIEGADGRRHLDCHSGAGTLVLGHNHPVVLEATRRVLDSGAPLHVPDHATPVEDAFVTELLGTLPPGLAGHARVRFCGPGEGDAVRTALRLVRAATGRTEILALTCARACHGATAWAESGLDGLRSGTPRPAGVLLEPVGYEGGVLPAPDAWTRRVRQLTAARSVPLIADESHTGVGRTGAFWAVEHSGVTPDVMVLSGAVGGSLPLAAVVHRDDLGAAGPGTPSGALRGNQLAMAAGAATLSYVRANGLARRAAVLGARMLDRLRGLAAEFPCVGDVRGRGLMIGVELVDADADGDGDGDGDGEGERDRPGPAGLVEPVVAASRPPVPALALAGSHRPAPGLALAGSRRPAPGLALAVRRECLRRGLVVETGGRHAGEVRLLPPLTISDEQAAAVLDRLADALAAARDRTGRHGPPYPPGNLSRPAS
ncbi:aminotransferase class III-fold pyridoxal phosphate-dependent enzyme [Streptomyces sp. NPDC020996]|uniref:aminotransferase class III-fold pyridoxal phosphate-dependent enzyme n=1 Tax=Streptomyces sp. NPDC020996 TaxID=3154791 RepID=UPI0033CC0FF8